MKRTAGLKKALALAFACGLAFAAQAGNWIIHVRMYDETVVTMELASVPVPDENGLYHLHPKDRGDIIVHASNVWIEAKSHRTKAKK